ncbi:Bug family tripartite tricarboxylate transporter substrate binding protein [Variovorax sp. VNK109]|uniref:Bug family tripartite tricarboxylate transporter substrate binding protein n=1 Tax=Variovorax sp. VNK109 TaxID=3400919 RepID=UPI003BFBC86F
MNTPSRRFLLNLWAALAIFPTASLLAVAQDFPARPIRVVVPYPPGGAADKLARDVAADLQKRVNQPVYVENRQGAAGNIGFDAVARMPADGYTLLMAPASNLTVQSVLFKKLSYDLDKDFAPVSVLLQTPQVLVVNAALPVNNVKELVQYARKNPGKTNFGAITGAYQHLAGEMLKTQTGADFEPVAYQGPAPALNDLLGGQTQFMFTEMMNVLPHVSSGKLRPIAVTSRTRTPWMPQVPTMSELGFTDFEVSTWYSFVIHSGTPKPAVDYLSREIRAVLAAPDFRKRYEDVGAFTVGSTPEEMQDFVRKESVRWQAVVKRVGIQPN